MSTALSYKTALIRLLDRPGGRFLLGKIATRIVRSAGGDGIEIGYLDGLWTRRVGPHFLPDAPKFDYTYTDFAGWRMQFEKYATDTKEYWLQHYSPKEGDVVVDVGAGRGEDTLTFSRLVGRSGRVVAIEAHPLSFAILKNFCRLNELDNVIPVHAAATDHTGTVRMSESASSWMENAVDSNGSDGVSVPANTLNEICQENGVGTIHFLKMNIEGAERQALAGMDLVIKNVRQICVACHDFRADLGHGEHFRTRAFVEQFLTSHGFTFTSRRGDSRDYVRDHLFGFSCG